MSASLNSTNKPLVIAGTPLSSRLLLGTGKFASAQHLRDAVISAGSDLVTLALRRVRLQGEDSQILTPLREIGVRLLPNTSGARTAEEAVYAARLAREALGTHWLKLEIHPDPRYLMPDPVATLQAARQLVDEGFVVLPYCSADPALCRLLEEAGCAAVMPLGAPIGSNRGLVTRDMLEIIIEQSRVPVVVDAGIGAPSHAALAMELGADAVLVNTAIATAGEPALMAQAFRLAVEAGQLACESRLASASTLASASSPLERFLHTLPGELPV